MEEKFSIVQMVKKILPAMVSITSSKYLLAKTHSPVSGLFKRKQKSLPGLRQNYLVPLSKKRKIEIGSGSGFIVSENGVIFTNRHVIEDPKSEYLVILQNGEKIKPEILAKDPLNDAAILKIEKSGLPTVELGDSSKIELGEEVIAIGNALGLFQNTVSRGVISGLSRAITAQSSFDQKIRKLRGLIQTDAAINPGNSGGPLVNRQGQVIGINAAMVMGAENIGFALPINNVKKDLSDLKKYGRIRQPFLGLRYVFIDKELKEKFNLPTEQGALVIPEPGPQGFREAVLPGSPARKAGVKEGDIILEINGRTISKNVEIEEILQSIEVGEKIILKIIRNNKEKTLKAVLGEKK